MVVLGVWGGLKVNHERAGHDACAVLLRDGECVSAIEEERLVRVKHTRRAPVRAIRFCLDQAGITPEDIDLFAFGLQEREGVRAEAADMLQRAFNVPVNPRKLVFIEHQVAHAYSSYAASGFETSLVVSLDGQGDSLAGMIGIASPTRLRRLRDIAVSDSLGHLYLAATQLLGYRLFDEYKVMGLAPYGEPSRFRDVVRTLYTLGRDGCYMLCLDRVQALYEAAGRRRRGEPFTQAHMDLAAAIQEALESIVLHVLQHFRATTGVADLCLAGGVAHNCSMNGKVAASGLFEHLFIHPAANDAGTAYGAAALAHLEVRDRSVPPLCHVYTGTPVPSDAEIDVALRRWHPRITWRRSTDVCAEVATVLANQAVVGWVQGRSEFGPRALGNRSIVADPRPVGNKDRINAMVKKREAFRPFAPAVLAEHASEFFEVPSTGAELPYMLLITPVRPNHRATLGAVTHVDGSARVQTVIRRTNERFWHLIESFRQLTGVPILLNTSFNNAWEPIVDSVDDAIVCFLTTDLDYLVIGDYIIEKPSLAEQWFLDLVVQPSAHVTLWCTTGAAERRFGCRFEDAAVTRLDGEDAAFVEISERMYQMLAAADGVRTARTLAIENGLAVDAAASELLTLWERRVVAMRPLQVEAIGA